MEHVPLDSRLYLFSYFNFFIRNNLPVIRSKDCTEIDWSSNGRQMLQIFQDAPDTPNIFEAFEYMDAREDWLISQRNKSPKSYYNYSHPYGYSGFGQSQKEDEEKEKQQ